jgi:hypothetical protein
MYNIFCPWYFEKSQFRRQELEYCIVHNCNNPLLENIFIFPESRKDKLPKLNEKVHIIHLDKRVTYLDIINFINSQVDSYRFFNIISNTDIYFDDSLNLIRQLDMKMICLSLTRWESNPENNNHGTYQYMNYQSCDVWIFKSYIYPDVNCDFYLGKAGCEGRFNFELQKVGYKVYNPSKDIRCLHYHVSGKRNWSEDDRLQGPCFNPPIISIDEMINNGY